MYLTNHLLISAPQLNNDIFKRSVVFVCQHNADGAIGLIINKPSGIKLAEIFKKINLKLKREDLSEHEVFIGGPMQLERGFVLHEKIIAQESSKSYTSAELTQKTIYISSLDIKNNLELTTSFDILESLSMNAGPKQIFFALGCSSWSAGQLEDEIKRNAWLTIPAKNQQLIFTTPAQQRYEQALNDLGISEQHLITHSSDKVN